MHCPHIPAIVCGDVQQHFMFDFISTASNVFSLRIMQVISGAGSTSFRDSIRSDWSHMTDLILMHCKNHTIRTTSDLHC